MALADPGLEACSVSALFLSSCRWLCVAWLVAALSGCNQQRAEPIPREREQLASLLASYRPPVGRLAGFAYAPLPSSPLSSPVRGDLFALWRQARARARRLGPAEDLAALAVFDLVAGHIDAAAAKLSEAKIRSPGNAVIASDLTAAYLCAGRLRNAPKAFFLALAAAEAAVRDDHHLGAALFNRALALEEVSLDQDAIRAWHDVLEIDQASGWAAEARRHLADLTRPQEQVSWRDYRPRLDSAALAGDVETVRQAVTRLPKEARDYAEEVALVNWPKARHDRRFAAARWLQIGSTLAGALADVQGDSLIRDALAGASSSDPQGAALGGPSSRLLDALERYRRAREIRRSHRPAEAMIRSLQAARLFARIGNPLALSATLEAAICSYDLGDYEGALRRLASLEAGADGRRYPSILARTFWMEGLCLLSKGQPAESLVAYKAALRLAIRMQRLEDTAILHHLLAENLRYLGEDREEWAHRYLALQISRRAMPPARHYPIFDETAQAIQSQLNPETALLFRNEVLRLAAGIPDNLDRAFALIRRAGTLHLMRMDADAMADLDQARRICASLRDDSTRRRWQANLADVEAGIRVDQGRGNGVAQLLKPAFAFYKATGYRFGLATLYCLRARADLLELDRRAAESDLVQGIEELELQRSRIVDDELKATYFRQARRAFDSLISVYLKTGQKERSFEVAERDRARALLDHWRVGTGSSRGAARPLTTPELMRSLPGGVCVVEYRVLPDRVVAWILSRNGLALRQSGVDPRNLGALLARLNEAVERKEGDWRLPAADAYDAIFRFVAADLSRCGLLVVVPDAQLHIVPFSALYDARTGRYLVESHAILIAPSASFFVAASRRARWLQGRSSGRPLVVADPSTRGVLDAPALPAARSEARALARLYGKIDMLVGDKATKTAFVGTAGEHAWLHFSGHAVADSTNPAFSRVLLAPGRHDDGVLYAHEIVGMRFRVTRLVVLAACNSTGGPVDDAEGPLSLARSFLGAGVPVVVATLWPIEDQASALFFVALHSHLSEGSNAPEALRQAQLTFIRSSQPWLRSPRIWAAVEVIGGVRLSKR